MARRKTEEEDNGQPVDFTSETAPTSRDLMTIIQRKEFIMGLATVLIILGGVVVAFGIRSYQKGVQEKSELLNSQPMEEKEEVVSQEKKDMNQVTKLANTSVAVVEVKPGDSYARLSKRFCGDESSVEEILKLNQYQTLQPGDRLTVTCNQ